MTYERVSVFPLARFLRQKWFTFQRRLVPSAKERYRLELLTGPIGYWDRIQDYQIRFLVRMGLEPRHMLFDIGCGPLSGGLAFIGYLQPGHYVGIDIRKEPITEGYIQLVKAGLTDKNPILAVSGSFGREELNGLVFDYVWASQVLYHLDGEQIDACFEQVSARMTPESRFYGDIIGSINKVQPDSQWNGFEFHLHTIEDLEALAGKHGLELRHVGKLRDFGYPEELSLSTSDMLEFRLAGAG